MAETVEITQIIEKIETGVGELRSTLKTTEERLQAQFKTAFERYGLSVDGEAENNLLKAAEKVADLEVMVERLRRSRGVPADVGPDSNGIMPLLDAKTGKPVKFGTKNEKALKWKGLYTALGTEAYAAAFERGLASHLRPEHMSKEDQDLLFFKVVPDEIERLLPPGVRPYVKAQGLSTDFEPGAGIFAPATMESEITRRALEVSPFEALARTVNIGSNRYEGPRRTTNRDTIRMTGERATPAQETQLKRYEMLAIDCNQFTVYPALTQVMIEDGTIDLGAELQTDAGDDFGVLRGQHFIKGTGSGEPEGVMVSEELKALASGLASTFDMDGLIKLPQELATEYKLRGSYLLSRSAVTKTMLFRDDSGGVGTGQYLWQPSKQDGTPSRLNGYNWAEMVDMDAVAANAYPVAFGDWFRVYRIAERRGIRVLRDELTQDPFVVYRMSRRYGGRVWLGEAGVKLKCATAL